MADVTRRMLALLATLQSGHRFPGDELARRLEVSPRTLRRDIERLRTYGYPVMTQPGPGGFYRLGAGGVLPPLMLDDDEAVATLVGLAMVAATATPGIPGGLNTAAERAYGTIDQLLPRSLRPKVQELRSALEAAPQLAPPANPQVLALVATANHRREIVTFDYVDKAGNRSYRRIEPHRLLLRHLRWYLFGWDVDRSDWRVFRVDRVDALRNTGQSFSPRTIPAGSADAYLREGLINRQRTVVIIAAPAAYVADVFTWQDCTIEPLGPACCRLTTWLEAPEWLLLKLARLDVDFHIREPAAWRRWCARFARRLSSVDAGSEDDSGG